MHWPDIDEDIAVGTLMRNSEHCRSGFGMDARPETALCPMNIKCSPDADKRHIEFREGETGETRDLHENTLLDIEAAGRIVAMTIEHTRERVDIPQCSFGQIAA